MAKGSKLKLDPKPVVEVSHEKLEKPIEVKIDTESEEVEFNPVSNESAPEKVGQFTTVVQVPQGESENAADPRFQGRPAKRIYTTSSGATCYDW